MTDVTIIVPYVSDDEISRNLIDLTEILMLDHGAETTGGFLGGEFGYGAFFENDTFMMHPYCWCEQDGCAWCFGPAPNFLHKPSQSKVWWYKYIGRGMETDIKQTWSTLFGDCLESLEKEEK